VHDQRGLLDGRQLHGKENNSMLIMTVNGANNFWKKLQIIIFIIMI